MRSAPPAAASQADTAVVMTSYGRQATRFTGIYGLGMAALLPFSLLSLAVTTRYLSIADYGRLATLFAVAGLLTLVAGLGIVQGTIRLVYRSGDEGGDDGDGATDTSDVLGPVEEEYGLEEKRRILGSGFVLVVLVATVVAAPVALAASPLSALLLGSARYATAVQGMAFSVWAGALWRMAHQIWRLERQAWVWVAFQVLRPALAVIGTVVALAAGMGIEGPLLATGAGTVLAVAACMLASRRCWLFRPRVADAVAIWAVGRRVVGMQLAMLIQGNVSILLLAALASSSSVGIYAVALRVAMIPSYFGHGFFLSWPTLDASPIGMAARLRKGRAEHAASVFTLLCLGMLGLVVTVSLSGNGLLHVVAPGYAAAADLIPVIAAGELGLIVFRGIYRAARFPTRRRWHISLTLGWMFPFVVVAALLLPVGPTWAIAVANVAASAVVSAAFVWRDRRGEIPTPFQWARLTFATVAAATCIVAVELSPTAGWGRAALVLLGIVVFPLVLLGLGVVPREQVRMVGSMLRVLLPAGRAPRGLTEQLGRLPRHEREALHAALVAEGDDQELARVLGVSTEIARTRVTRALRRLLGDDRASAADSEIGHYLLSTTMVLGRDAHARRLAHEGIDPFELDRLDGALEQVRRRYRLRRFSRSGRWGLDPAAGPGIV